MERLHLIPITNDNGDWAVMFIEQKTALNLVRVMLQPDDAQRLVAKMVKNGLGFQFQTRNAITGARYWVACDNEASEKFDSIMYAITS